MNAPKFRAVTLRAAHKEFVYGFLTHHEQIMTDDGWASVERAIERNTLGFSLQTEDKNGKEVYGGDIIRAHTTLFGIFDVPVKWDTEKAGFVTVCKDAKQYHNPPKWNLQHDAVSTHKFGELNRLLFGAESCIGKLHIKDGEVATIYDFEIVGNIHGIKE